MARNSKNTITAANPYGNGSASTVRRAGKAKPSEPLLGFSDIASEVPEEMKEIMRRNSQTLREMITN